MDYGKITVESKVYTLTSQPEFEYRSHYNGFQITHPDNYLSAMAKDIDGNTYKIWWFVEDTNVELDSINYDNVDSVEKVDY